MENSPFFIAFPPESYETTHSVGLLTFPVFDAFPFAGRQTVANLSKTHPTNTGRDYSYGDSSRLSRDSLLID
jgi:hypothetical protein